MFCALSPPGWFGLWFEIDHINSTQYDRHYSGEHRGEMFCFSVHVNRKKREKSEVDGWLKE